METLKCIKERRSVRRYLDKKIPREDIKEIIDAASYAPSWKNTQITRYIVIDDRELIDKIADECVMDFTYNIKTLKKAPALVLLNAVLGKSGYTKEGEYATTKEDRWENFDVGLAAQTFCLAAKEKGIGTVIMGIFDEYKTAELVPIPYGQKIVAFIAMGYETEEKLNAPARKSVEELLTFIGDDI